MSDNREILGGFEQGLETLNESVVTRDSGTGKTFDAAEAYAIQKDLRKKFSKMNTSDLHEMLDIQAARQTGKQASSDVLNQLAVANPNIAKLLDSSGGTGAAPGKRAEGEDGRRGWRGECGGRLCDS